MDILSIYFGPSWKSFFNLMLLIILKYIVCGLYLENTNLHNDMARWNFPLQMRLYLNLKQIFKVEIFC